MKVCFCDVKPGEVFTYQDIQYIRLNKEHDCKNKFFSDRYMAVKLNSGELVYLHDTHWPCVVERNE